MNEASTSAKLGFEEEALPHIDAVYRFALRLSGEPDRAEDLVQETFLRAYRSWDQYTRGTAAKSWLFTICRNVFLRQHERARRHERVVEETAIREGAGRESTGREETGALWASMHGADPEGEFFDSIVDDWIMEAIAELPEDFRSAVVLSDVEGLPYADIAELMDVPVGTVKSRLFRGRRRLQETLYDYAVEMGYVPAREGVEPR